MTRALDMSNWSGPFTDTEAACVAGAGIPLVICETVDAGIYLQQMQSAERHGLRRMAYVWETWGNAVEQTRRGLEVIRSGPSCEIGWLDVEAARGVGITQDEVISELAQGFALCDAAGIPSGSYCSTQTWKDLTGNTTEFSDRPLWLAGGHYYDAPDLPDDATLLTDAAAREHPGGWTKALIYQVGNTRLVCGQSVDVNVLNEGGDEMWTRLNDQASWWAGKDLTAGGQMYLSIDFPKLPGAARAVDLEVFLDPASGGTLVFRDGDGSYAGQVNPLRRQAVIRIVPKGRTCRFEVSGNVRTQLVGILGYLS
jgi:hypothetical protein